jgi:hypothetical protein
LNVQLKKPIPDFWLPTERINMFGKTLQMLVQDHNMLLGLRCGRLMMNKMYVVVKDKHKIVSVLNYVPCHERLFLWHKAARA